ncbi:MAG TPA: carboxymuconolactone decarboxylase family protein [Burkholderiales bacterium]|jgi:4-carboxymuconolactone decarboxylase
MTDPTAGSRFPLLARESMSAEQRDLYERRMVGPWADLRGPFNAFMRNPAMADKALDLGNHIRHGNSLSEPLTELAILVTGRHWSAQYEWWAHYKRAKAAGLPMHIADAIAAGRRPGGMQPDQEALYDFCIELHETQQVSDTTWARARALFSEQQILDLIATCGFYVLISMVLNVARPEMPGGEAPPLQPLK